MVNKGSWRWSRTASPHWRSTPPRSRSACATSKRSAGAGTRRAPSADRAADRPRVHAAGRRPPPARAARLCDAARAPPRPAGSHRRPRQAAKRDLEDVLGGSRPRLARRRRHPRRARVPAHDRDLARLARRGRAHACSPASLSAGLLGTGIWLREHQGPHRGRARRGRRRRRRAVRHAPRSPAPSTSSSRRPLALAGAFVVGAVATYLATRWNAQPDGLARPARRAVGARGARRARRRRHHLPRHRLRGDDRRARLAALERARLGRVRDRDAAVLAWLGSTAPSRPSPCCARRLRRPERGARVRPRGPPPRRSSPHAAVLLGRERAAARAVGATADEHAWLDRARRRARRRSASPPPARRASRARLALLTLGIGVRSPTSRSPRSPTACRSRSAGPSRSSPFAALLGARRRPAAMDELAATSSAPRSSARRATAAAARADCAPRHRARRARADAALGRGRDRRLVLRRARARRAAGARDRAHARDRGAAGRARRRRADDRGARRRRRHRRDRVPRRAARRGVLAARRARAHRARPLHRARARRPAAHARARRRGRPARARSASGPRSRSPPSRAGHALSCSRRRSR